MSAKKSFAMFVMLVLAVLFIACSPSASQVSGSMTQRNPPAQVAMRVPDSLSVVKGYYSALKMKDMDAALTFLADDIVLLKFQPADGFSQTIKGKQAVASTLEYSNVLSFSIENMRGNGERVNFEMTEWLDPRVVGPNYPQPHKSHLTAVVVNGEIVSITESPDANLALRTK